MDGEMLLMSIKPDFAEKILAGAKTIELRRKFSSRWVGSEVVLYATFPVQAIVGRMRICNVFQDTPAKIWKAHGKSAGCTKQHLLDYADGLEKMFAVEMAETLVYEKQLKLADACSIAGKKLWPPQSCCSLCNNQDWLRVIRAFWADGK
jgi:predicted transcriptional regulator